MRMAMLQPQSCSMAIRAKACILQYRADQRICALE
jgi:hypothetical protein